MHKPPTEEKTKRNKRNLKQTIFSKHVRVESGGRGIGTKDCRIENESHSSHGGAEPREEKSPLRGAGTAARLQGCQLRTAATLLAESALPGEPGMSFG